jgi:hypothetical protein
MLNYQRVRVIHITGAERLKSHQLLPPLAPVNIPKRWKDGSFLSQIHPITRATVIKDYGHLHLMNQYQLIMRYHEIRLQ